MLLKVVFQKLQSQLPLTGYLVDALIDTGRVLTVLFQILLLNLWILENTSIWRVIKYLWCQQPCIIYSPSLFCLNYFCNVHQYPGTKLLQHNIGNRSSQIFRASFCKNHWWRTDLCHPHQEIQILMHIWRTKFVWQQLRDLFSQQNLIEALLRHVMYG